MRIIAAIFLLLLPLPSAAQQVIASYSTLLGTQDMRNSRGVRLTDICAVVQQDRANFHRFGRRDPGDQYDPIFGTLETRSAIPSLCVVTNSYDWIQDGILRGEPRWIWVQVLGGNGFISQVQVREGAG